MFNECFIVMFIECFVFMWWAEGTFLFPTDNINKVVLYYSFIVFDLHKNYHTYNIIFKWSKSSPEGDNVPILFVEDPYGAVVGVKLLGEVGAPQLSFSVPHVSYSAAFISPQKQASMSTSVPVSSCIAHILGTLSTQHTKTRVRSIATHL